MFWPYSIVFCPKKMQLWRTIFLTPFKLITVFLHEASHAIACKLTCGQVRCFLFITLIFFCKLAKFPCCVSCVFLLAIVWNTKFLWLSLPHTPILPRKKKKKSLCELLFEWIYFFSFINMKKVYFQLFLQILLYDYILTLIYFADETLAGLLLECSFQQ